MTEATEHVCMHATMRKDSKKNQMITLLYNL